MTPQPFIDNRSKLPGTAAAMMQPWTRSAAANDLTTHQSDPRPPRQRRAALPLTGYARS